MQVSLRAVLFCILTAQLTPAVAWAVDGVVEINQVQALAGGVTASDTAGFPVSLDAPGSYRLTGNLSVTDANTHGIEVLADGVSIDLNGFELAGPITCTGGGSSISCGAGTGQGIRGPFRTAIVVRDGTIRGFGFTGVNVGHQSRIRDVLVRSNGGAGLIVNTRSIVSRCTAVQNGGAGIQADSGSIIEHSIASYNGATGLELSQGVIAESAASYNGGIGIHGRGSSTIRSNSATLNENNGIHVLSGAVITDNSSTTNGGDGISARFSSTVARNTVRNNAGYGLDLDSTSAYWENTINGNTTGTVSGGVNMLTNSCNGSAGACP